MHNPIFLKIPLNYLTKGQSTMIQLALNELLLLRWCKPYEKCCLQRSGTVEYSLLYEPAVDQRRVGVTGAVGFKVRREGDALCSCITVWEWTAY